MKSKIKLLVWCVLGLLVVVLGISLLLPSCDYKLIDGKEESDGRVLLIKFSGTIEADSDAVDRLILQLKQAKDDSSVGAVVLKVNSGGGDLVTSDVLFDKIHQLVLTKPVVIYISQIGASGAYYMSLAATRIVAHPSSLTGSVGVIMTQVRYNDLLLKLGVANDVYKSGDMKDIMSATRAASPTEVKVLDDIISVCAARFYKRVEDNRHLSNAAMQRVQTGSVFLGSEALSMGLIDKTGYVEDAYSLAKQVASLKINAPVYEFKDTGLSAFFDALSSQSYAVIPSSFVNLKMSLH